MDDELFWNDDYNLISHIAGAIREDLAKVETVGASLKYTEIATDTRKFAGEG